MNKYIQLYNGLKVPTIALGTWQVPEGDICYNAVKEALLCGYRHIDTAAAYQNEKSVGKAIKDSNIDRKDIFITTKLPAEIKTYQEAKKYIDQSLTNLGVDYIDLYLIHAPWPWNEIGKDCTKGNIEVWKAIIEAYNDHKFKAIGVSNFNQKQIEDLIYATGIKPMANQICFHIGLNQKDIYDYCNNNNIVIEAYSPLATGRLLNDDRLIKLANKYNTSVAKICLSYCLAKNVVILPKSVHKERIIDNFNIDITLDKKDIEYLDNLD